ncbi:MAG TPA: HAMP domain-containing sensor histidine kinase [Phenylobacterium sp.]|nr:HAMP domain-containing sensor histidine kinase [Phenylobacterium sp.]
MTARARPRVSIGVQLVALLMACLLLTHLIIYSALVIMPPPRPAIYRVAEIAGALKGGSLATRLGRPLTRTVAAALPPDLQTPRRGFGHIEAVAAALGAAPQDVRFAMRPPSVLERVFHGSGQHRVIYSARLGGPHPEPGRGPGPGSDMMFATGGPPPGEPGGPPGFALGFHGEHGFRFRMMSGEMPIVGDFMAALRGPDGRWTIVQSSPEPFPTEWEQRAFLLFLASFAVVAPAGFLFARRITAPLKRFSEAAERLGRDPHGAQMTLSGPAEIGAAAEAFNDMQSRLKRYIDDRTAMVGAISHDLRTPLARIRFKLENAPRELKGSILGDVAQMEQMIQGVLTFIRNESTPRHREKLELLSLVECVADDAAMLGGDVEVTTSEPVTVDGDAMALQRLFVNLVDNAVKYGGQARIAVSRTDGHAVVEVTDAGPGLEPDELEKVFQPFYRADPSRNVDAGGIGLGLPIARSTARAHGGDLELANATPGLTARVTLPVA